MAKANAAVKSWYTERLREFYAGRFQAYLDDTDPDNERFPSQHELSTAAVAVDRQTGWPALPGEVRTAAEYYYDRVEAEDWGSVRVYRVPTDSMDTFAVRVTTDGDDGWLEVYDPQGHFLAAGRTYIELIAWAAREKVRQQFGDNWPKALDTRKTLWQVPAGPPPQPRFKAGQPVECRWQWSMIWFPARVARAELDRVEVEFDDGSREWIQVDHVREVYEGREAPEVLPGMEALAPGDRVEFQSRGDTVYHPATVLERRGSRLRVRMNDDAEEWTLPALCRPPTPDEPEPVPPLAVGDRVQCRWRGSSESYLGQVVERQGDRLRVKYEDGSEEWTTRGWCRRLVEEGKTRRGPARGRRRRPD
jgi:hypothetical protein